MTARPSALGAREVAVLGMLGAVLFGSKAALAWLPNVEPVSLLVIVYTVVLGWRALFPICVYILLEYVTWGFGLWSACYLYVWPLLALTAWLLRRMEAPLGWAVVSGAFGLCFGALCALMYLAAGGWAFAVSWWVQGIPFDLIHCGGTFVLALALFRPCRELLARLAGPGLSDGRKH